MRNSIKDMNIPFYERTNILTGECLGKGSFSKVCAITRIRHRDTSSFSTSSTVTTTKATTTNISYWKKKGSSLMLSLLSSTHKNRYALKALRNSTLRKEEKFVRAAARDLKNELRILSLLNHDNIISLHGFGKASKNIELDNGKRFENIFLILDHLDDTLDKRISDWTLFEASRHQYDSDTRLTDEVNVARDKISIALQVVSALKYLHESGYIFRDLKSQNIGLMNHNNEDPEMTTKVKLFDFGISRKLPDTPANIPFQEPLYRMSYVGSPRYMAPEVHNREKYNQKADVYSWSILFYLMVTLEKPYRYGLQEHVEKVCQNGERPKFPRGKHNSIFVPEKIQTLIKNSWKQNVSERYSIATVHEELSQYYNEMQTPKDNNSVTSLVEAKKTTIHKKLFNTIKTTDSGGNANALPIAPRKKVRAAMTA